MLRDQFIITPSSQVTLVNCSGHNSRSSLRFRLRRLPDMLLQYIYTSKVFPIFFSLFLLVVYFYPICSQSFLHRELGLYITPPDVLRMPAHVQQAQIGSWSGFALEQANTCTCGFRLVVMLSFCEDSTLSLAKSVFGSFK